VNYRAMRILVADDEATARLLMQAALGQAGFETILAEDGHDALDKFATLPCDMVMLDVDMPRLDGYATCARLRGLVGDELPIVMVTAMDDVASIEHAFHVGATDFIAKPINWSILGQRLRYLTRANQVLQDLHTANARNSAILNALPDTLLRLDGDGMVLAMHRPAQAGAEPGPDLPAAGETLPARLPRPAAERILAAAAQVRAEGGVATIEYQVEQDRDGTRYFEARLAGILGQEALCLVRDITERKAAEHDIHRLAYFDTLTGLPNRHAFGKRLDLEIARAREHAQGMAVLFLDLDGFKNVNDTLGHSAGDILLQWVADRLRQSIRSTDLVSRVEFPMNTGVELARLGGDEFTVLIPYLRQAEHALHLAQRIHEAMRQPFNLDGKDRVLTTSIGIAIYPEDGENAEALLKHADTAMYHAKNQGRDNCQFYSATLSRDAMRRLDLLGGLRKALERDEFHLEYQPQLDLASGRVDAVEALLRWDHPEHGAVSPAEFIPLAEENGLIVPIGEWVLGMACGDAAKWRDAGMPISLAVNLSAIQFKHPMLLSEIARILARTGLPADALELEVTEGALMEDSAATLATLDAIRGLGVHLALDDFGTGYSSLSYLKRLPLNNLKVDQSFVRGLPGDRENLAIAKAIVGLAKNLGFTVTAEGIETLEQARLFRDMGCETLQGFYIGKPLRAGAVPTHFTRHWNLGDIP
jgi:diguanylate cyclase (GGDEF)-like protein